MKTLMRIVVIGSITFSFAPTRASQGDKLESRPLANPIPFATLDEAAVAALRIAVQNSRENREYEFAGCLYVEGQKYYFTQAVSQRNDQFRIECAVADQSFRGIYHTHPSGLVKTTHGLSSVDVETAKQLSRAFGLEIVSYVALMEMTSPHVVKFVPGKTKTECSAVGTAVCPSRAIISAGDFVTSIESL